MFTANPDKPYASIKSAINLELALIYATAGLRESHNAVVVVVTYDTQNVARCRNSLRSGVHIANINLREQPLFFSCLASHDRRSTASTSVS